MDTILIATQDPHTSTAMRRILSPDERIHVANSVDQVWELIKTGACDCLFIDLSLMEKLSDKLDHKEDTKVLVQHIKGLRPLMAIVIIAGNDDVRKAVRYVKKGANNYITAPFDAHEVRLVMDEISMERRRHSELSYLRERMWKDDSLDIVQTLSPNEKSV